VSKPPFRFPIGNDVCHQLFCWFSLVFCSHSYSMTPQQSSRAVACIEDRYQEPHPRPELPPPPNSSYYISPASPLPQNLLSPFLLVQRSGDMLAPWKNCIGCVHRIRMVAIETECVSYARSSRNSDGSSGWSMPDGHCGNNKVRISYLVPVTPFSTSGHFGDFPVPYA
jgi:hypothetical protein